MDRFGHGSEHELELEVCIAHLDDLVAVRWHDLRGQINLLVAATTLPIIVRHIAIVRLVRSDVIGKQRIHQALLPMCLTTVSEIG